MEGDDSAAAWADVPVLLKLDNLGSRSASAAGVPDSGPRYTKNLGLRAST